MYRFKLSCCNLSRSRHAALTRPTTRCVGQVTSSTGTTMAVDLTVCNVRKTSLNPSSPGQPCSALRTRSPKWAARSASSSRNAFHSLGLICPTVVAGATFAPTLTTVLAPRQSRPAILCGRLWSAERSSAVVIRPGTSYVVAMVLFCCVLNMLSPAQLAEVRQPE